MNEGKLYIISSPIGNLQDISLRALETLKSIDYVLSEDTRETTKLLDKYGLRTPQISYRDQNHHKIIDQITQDLKMGKNIGLISDSGTPSVSDPGFKLVRELIAQGITITTIPGASVVISALVVSGLPTDKFTFLGFLPKDAGPRKKTLESYGVQEATLTIFESPFRVLRLLTEVQTVLGERYCCLVNDLTKVHELITRGYVSELIDELHGKKLRGEFVVLVSKQDYEPK